MEIRTVLKSQYRAALKTLREAVEKCPQEMWEASSDGVVPFWRVAYHTLFFTQFYSLQDRSLLKPWAKHRRGAESLGSSWSNPPYTRDEILEYARACDDLIGAAVDALNLEAPQCGFPWYKMSTLEHQIVNIRHIQHHAAALSMRLRQAGIEVGWVQSGGQ